MAENDIRFVKAEECCSGVGTSPPSSIDVSPEQIQGRNGPQMKRKRGSSTNCHQCHKNRENILQCKRCNKQYCITCAKRWYPDLKGASFAESCPMCRNICNCGACLQSKGASKMQDLQITREQSLYFSKYTIRVLLPSLKKFAEESRDNDVAELLARAKGVAGIHDICGQPTSERSCSCLTSDGWSIDTCKACSRDQADDNYLYCPLASDTEISDLQHFQFHFSNGQPVIVRKVLSGILRLSWEPTVVERALRICQKNGNNSLDICVLNCSNRSEEMIPIAKFFEGYSKGMFDKHGYGKILKLEEWPLSGVFQEQMPRHNTEVIRCLPFKHYTHPAAGSLNVPAKLPELPILNVGPKMSVHYGPHGTHEGSQWDSITKLQYTVSDRVNILMHVASSTLQELSTLEKLDKSTLKDHEDAEAGTLWDVFRKQDVPKLEEYLRKYDQELRPILYQHQAPTVHSIHDQTFFLTMEHKRRLKDEYGVEPWTFLQKLGDAVIIPARCFYQLRNLKSCIHVAVDFVSPECLAESDHLSEKLACLTPGGILEETTCQAKTLILHAIQEAVEDLEKIA